MLKGVMKTSDFFVSANGVILDDADLLLNGSELVVVVFPKGFELEVVDDAKGLVLEDVVDPKGLEL